MIRIKDASLQIKIYEDTKTKEEQRKLTLVRLKSNAAPV